MRVLILTTLLMAFASFGYTQTDTAKFYFLNHLIFKNDKAKVVIKATYLDFHRSGDEIVFARMSKEKKLRFSDYFLRCCGGSAIHFSIEHSKREYDLVMRERIKFDINNCRPGDIIYLTCLVFKGEKEFDGSPLVVITDISSSAPAE